MRIAVIGSGYVGLVSATCFAEIGHDVISVDNDHEKIATLNRGGVPIHERFLPELIKRHHGKRLQFSTNIQEAVRASEVVFITVGTPQSENGEADLSFVEAVANEIAAAIDGRKVIVEKSTVPVRTCDSLRQTLLFNGALPDSFFVASNPEFLREGTAVLDFLYPDRIVVGVDDLHSASVMQEIYAPLTSGSYYLGKDVVPGPVNSSRKARLILTNAKSAELIKHASNAFLAMKISFINAVASVSEAVGADITEVCAGIGADTRIGPKFLNAGIGYGGSCFPKDVKAFHAVSAQNGYAFGLLDEVMRINEEQRSRFLRKIRSALWTLRGKRLGVLGLAFKGGTDDVRESPAIAIIEALLKEGALVTAYDPVAESKASAQLAGKAVTFAADPYQAAAGSDALLILTEWKEFAELDLNRLRNLLKYPVLIDGRNLYEPQKVADAGLVYYSIGRAAAVPEKIGAKIDSITELPNAARINSRPGRTPAAAQSA
jgi:UDPglucose 6-dehydrogenase